MPRQSRLSQWNGGRRAKEGDASRRGGEALTLCEELAKDKVCSSLELGKCHQRGLAIHVICSWSRCWSALILFILVTIRELIVHVNSCSQCGRVVEATAQTA